MLLRMRVVEQDRVLRDDGDLRAQRRDRQVANIVAVDEQPPAGDIEEARQQMYQRGLAAAAGADDGDDFPGRRSQVDVVQHLASFVTVRSRSRNKRARSRCPDGRAAARSAFGFSRISSCESRKLKIAEEAPSACWKLLLNWPNFRTGSYSLKTATMKARKMPSVKTCVDAVATQQDQQRDGDRAEDVHHRRADGCGADGAQVGAEQAPGSLAEAARLPRFHAERLHDAHAGDGFVQDVLDLGQLVLTLASGAADPAPDAPRRQQ